MARLRIVSHDRSLRGHVQRQCIMTPLLGIASIRKGGWGKQYQKIKKKFHKWVYRMRTAWPSTETVRQMQLCFPPAAMLTGRKFWACKRSRFCPWCFARQTANVFDTLISTPLPGNDYVVLGFRNSRGLRDKHNDPMSAALRTDCASRLAEWIGAFRAGAFNKTLPAVGMVIGHHLVCTSQYRVSAQRHGVAIVTRQQAELWKAWENGPKLFTSERRGVRVYEDASPTSIARATVTAFKFPRYLFSASPDDLALMLRLRKQYRFIRKTGACYSNLGLKEESPDV